MATSTEEMILRLGMDASALRKGMADAANAAKQGSEKIDQGFSQNSKGAKELLNAFQDLAKGDWSSAVETSLKVLAEKADLFKKAMAFLFSGPGILAAGAVAAFLAIKKGLDDFNKDLDEQAAKAAKGYGDMGQSIKSATNEGAKGARSLSQHIADLADAQDNLKEKTDAAVKALRDQAVAELEVSNAKAAAQTAAVNAQEARGEISPEQAIIKRANIKNQAEQEQAAIKKAAQEAELAKITAAKEQAEKNKPILEQAAKTAQEAATGVDEKGNIVNPEAAKRAGKIKNIPNENVDLKKQAEDAKKKADEILAKKEDLEKKLKPTLGPNVGKDREVIELQEQYEQQIGIFQKSNEAIKSNEKLLIQLTTEQENAANAYKKAVQALDANNASFTALNLQVNELTQKIATENATGEKTKPFKTAQQVADEASELAGTAAGQEVKSLGQLASDISTGKDKSQGDAERLIKAESQIAGHKVDLKTAIEMAKTAAHNDAAFISHVGKLADTQQTIIDGLFQNGIVIRDTP